jgi:hypothetical protein
LRFNVENLQADWRRNLTPGDMKPGQFFEKRWRMRAFPREEARAATIRKFAPALLEVLEFKAARGNDPILAAIALLRNLNQSGKREVPPDAALPFRKEWRRLVTETGKPNRRLYETAVLATLRNKLRSGDV